MIAAIYARKSTKQDDVAEEAKSVTRQVDGARAFISAKGWTLDEAHIYTDDGVSGALFLTRPHFQRLLRDAEAGAFQAVVFYDLDRFGRQARDTMAALWTLVDLDLTIWDSGTGQQVDLDSMGGRVTVTMRAEVAQAERERTSARNTDAAWHKARAGYVAGGKIFGYDNVGPTGQRARCINEAEAAVVRSIYERFATGEGLRTIALALNRSGALSPRAQQGRPNGWSASSVREVLMRPVYRGEVVFGRTVSVHDRRAMRKVYPKTTREQGQVPRPEDTWFRSEAWADRLRIIDADLAARVDARRHDRLTRYHASVAKGGKVPERAHGTYLLSGGMLVCPTCGGHFEAVKSPWKAEGVYVCATRRRKPGVCTNTLMLTIAAADNAVLNVVEGEVLGTRFIEELLALVDRGEVDNSAQLTAERERLRREVKNLVGSIAAGVPAETVAPAIKEREADIARLDVKLRTPRQVPPNIETLRAALEQRAMEWRETLRAEPKVARLLLRRLIGPLTLTDPADHAAFDEWAASVTPALLDGLVHHVASPTETDCLPSRPARARLPTAA